jgi:SynChlorMet cassette protein ScmC
MLSTGYVKSATLALEIERAPRGEVRNCYRLQLANGFSWRLVTTDQSEGWIAEIAAAMRLKRCDPSSPPVSLMPNAGSSSSSRDDGKPVPDSTAGRGRMIRHRALRMKPLGNGTYLIASVKPSRGRPLNVERVWGSFFPFYASLIDSGGLPIHAALVRKWDRYVALAAKGRTGKSTCCRRLPEPWHGICDEEVVAVPVGSSGYRAHPFPTWSDLVQKGLRKSWEVESNFPLSAIYFLEQGEEDRVTPVDQVEAVVQLCRRVLEKCPFHEWGLTSQQERTVRLKIFENAQNMARSLPAYRLIASLGGRFWEKMEEDLEDGACSHGSRNGLGRLCEGEGVTDEKI